MTYLPILLVLLGAAQLTAAVLLLVGAAWSLLLAGAFTLLAGLLMDVTPKERRAQPPS